MKYDIDAYRDNTDNGSGLRRFLTDCLPKQFNTKWSNVHYEMTKLFFMLLDPARTIAIDRQAYFLVHRECGKSTFGNFGISMFLIYMNNKTLFLDTKYLGWKPETKEKYSRYLISPNSDIIEILLDEKYITIASETEGQACKHVENIKNTIEDRYDLVPVFGEKHPHLIEDNDEVKRKKKGSQTWKIKAFRTADNIFVEGTGAAQRYRGSLVRGSRPSFIILDDIYSEENTKTEDGRKKVDRWVYAAMKNTLDTQKGKVFWLGTMVHPDTIVKDFLHPKSKWFGIKRPIMSVNELHQVISKLTINDELQIPDLFTCLELQKSLKTLSWPEYHNLYSILSKYEENLIKGTLAYFYQEYMNEALAPENIIIPRETFHKLNIKFEVKYNRQLCYFEYDNMKWYGTCNLFVGVDPASSEHNNSDDTVIIVAGFARCYPIIEGYQNDYSITNAKSKVFPIIAELKAGKYATTKFHNMKGLAETLLALDNKYLFEYINIEANGQQQQMIWQIINIFQSNEDYAKAIRNPINMNPHAQIFPEYSSGKKEERIRSTLFPLIQQHKIVLCNTNVDVDKLYSQLIMLGFTDHDDYPDAWAIAMKNVKVPKINDIKTISNNNNNNNDYVNRVDNLIKQYGDDWRYYL